MPYDVSDKEFAAVLGLTAPKRYEYFIKRVADGEVVRSLGGIGGWALLGDTESYKTVPVWPHGRYAAACATGDWASNEPCSIPFAEWIMAWLPGIASDGRLIAMFPAPGGKGPVVTAERLKADLEEELRNYE